MPFSLAKSDLPFLSPGGKSGGAGDWHADVLFCFLILERSTIGTWEYIMVGGRRMGDGEERRGES